MESANLTWRKARASGSQGDCVELAFDKYGRATGTVRDSKSPERGHLTVTTERFAAFIADAKKGKLDLTVLAQSDAVGGQSIAAGPSSDVRERELPALPAERPGVRVERAVRARLASGEWKSGERLPAGRGADPKVTAWRARPWPIGERSADYMRGIRYDGYSDCLGEGTCGSRYAS